MGIVGFVPEMVTGRFVDYCVALPTARVRHPSRAQRGVRSGFSSRRPHNRPRGPKQHVRDQHLTMFIVRAVSVLASNSETTWSTSSTPRTTSKTRA